MTVGLEQQQHQPPPAAAYVNGDRNRRIGAQSELSDVSDAC